MRRAAVAVMVGENAFGGIGSGVGHQHAVFDVTLAGRALAEPQAMWFALWDNAANLTGSPYLNSTIWPATQRSKQYAGAHTVTVGGIALDIDSDLVNSAVAHG